MEKGILIITIIFLLILVGGWFLFLREPRGVESVEISQEIVNQLNDKFSKALLEKTEFVFCINGRIDNKIAKITRITSVKVVESSEDEIEIKKCFNSIGTIHNHNNGICKLSFRDIYSFGKSKDSIMGIICGENEIVFYIPRELDQGVEVNVL